MRCFWCGEEIKVPAFASEQKLGEFTMRFHRGLFKDCANQYALYNLRHETRLQKANSHPIGYS